MTFFADFQGKKCPLGIHLNMCDLLNDYVICLMAVVIHLMTAVKIVIKSDLTWLTIAMIYGHLGPSGGHKSKNGVTCCGQLTSGQLVATNTPWDNSPQNNSTVQLFKIIKKSMLMFVIHIWFWCFSRKWRAWPKDVNQHHPWFSAKLWTKPEQVPGKTDSYSFWLHFHHSVVLMSNCIIHG